MSPATPRSPATVILAACILGLVSAPFLYIALGAPLHLPLRFSLIMGPPLLAGAAFLLWRYLPAAQRRRSTRLLLLEGLSWLAVIGFLYFVSDFSLQTPIERLGLTCLLFLVATLFWIPLLYLKPNTAILERINRLNTATQWTTLTAVLLTSGGFGVNWLISTPAFI